MKETLIRTLISDIKKYSDSMEDYGILKEKTKIAGLSLYSLHKLIEAVNGDTYNNNSLNMNGFVKITPDRKETRLIKKQQEENESLRLQNNLLETNNSKLMKKHKRKVFYLFISIIIICIFLFRMWQSNEVYIDETNIYPDKQLVIDSLTQEIKTQKDRITEQQNEINRINKELPKLKSNQGNLTEKQKTIDSLIQIKESLESSNVQKDRRITQQNQEIRILQKTIDTLNKSK